MTWSNRFVQNGIKSRFAGDAQSMLKLQSRSGRFRYPLLFHPVSRVMKFERFYQLFDSLDSGDTVLDYGSGDRPMESLLRTKFKHYISADHPDANQSHAQRPDVFIVDDCIDIESDSIDCVVLTEVLEHIYEPRKALGEIHRVLKPGGKLIGTVPFAMNEHEQPYDFHRYTSFCLDRMFRDTGFRTLNLDYIGDMLGVAAITVSRILELFNKVLRKLHLGFLAAALSLVTRLPEFLYYGLVKSGANPQRLHYFRQYPIGFVFCAEKESG